MRLSLFCLACILALQAKAQLTPEITSWIINTDGSTGYGGIPSNVQQVQYSSDNVYVSCTCIPGYDIGPWTSNPNLPANQNFCFKITRHPTQSASPIATGLGHIGVWTNGVSIFNAKDGMSYMNAGIWNRNALYYEGVSFDTCLGHPAPNGEYHHHVNPRCLYDEKDSTHHSPIIGFAFDGYPIYGAYGYENIGGTGPIKRMRSSYVLSSATTRTSGPAVDATYPAGCFVEDYIYTPGAGDLDEHNGRFCVTPEYPLGTYAYFVTIDENFYPVYPYTIGNTYYGDVPAGNTGPASGHNTPGAGETVQTYTPTGVNELDSQIELEYFPNPAKDQLNIIVRSEKLKDFNIALTDITGRVVMQQNKLMAGRMETLELSSLASGTYFLVLEKNQERTVRKIVMAK